MICTPADLSDEAGRLSSLRRLLVLDSPPDPVFDAITDAAAQACNSPIALVSLIDSDRQWFKSNRGLPGVQETPREVAFCDHAIRSPALFEVADARLDPRFATNPLVTGDPRIRFYAGAPIVLKDGKRVGTVCVIDQVSRQLTDPQRAMLTSLGAIASAALESAASQVALSRRFRSLYEATPAILHSLDEQGRLISVSDRWLQVMGYERHEVIGRRSTEFLTPDSRRRAVEEVLPEFLLTGSCHDIAYQFIRKDGSLVDVLLSGTLERNGAGDAVRSLAVLQDVTETRRIANELVATHARLDAIVENVPAMLGYWDAGRSTRFVNRELQAAIGLPTELIIGRSMREVFDAIDPPSSRALSPHVDAVLLGQRQDFELPMITTSGLRQLSTTLIPDQPELGRITGFYAVAHDVTGLKSLELRLSASEERYRSLFDNLKSGFALHEIVVDANGRATDYRFLAMNAAFAAMVGVTREAAVGRRVTEVLPGTERDPADWIGVFGRVALTGESAHFEQWAAGLGHWLEVVAYRPAPGQFAVIATDITKRKQLELGAGSLTAS